MIRTTFLLTGIIFLFVSCIKKIDDLTIVPISPEIPLPVGYLTLSADNLTKIGDSLLLEEGEDGVLELYYESEILREALFDRLTIPDQSFNESLPFNSFAFMGGTDSQFKESKYDAFTISNIDLTSPPPALEQVVFKAGSLNIVQSKDFDHDLTTTIEFPELVKDGNPLSIVLKNNTSSSTGLITAVLDLTGVSGTATNTIDYEVTSVVSNTGSDIQGTVSISVSLTNMEFSFMKGDFNTYMFDEVSEIFETNLPQNEFPDDVAFTNPSVRITVSNSSGIPFGLDINELSITQGDGSVEQVTGSFDDETYNVISATVPGEKEDSNFLIDKNNTDNFVELLNQIPQSAFFNGQLTANHLGTPPEGNFVTDSSEIVVNSTFVIPLEGYANQYMLSDTLEANLDIEEESITPESANLRLQGENGFPFLVALQLYFLDSEDNSIVLDSLFVTEDEKQLFPPAQVDNSGLVTSPTVQINDIYVDDEKYERIRATGSIRITAFITTAGVDESPSKSVKVSVDNYFKLGIGVSLKATIDPNVISN
ncbi:MAG: hypothetical protein KDC58_05765 [Cyclobacteriaceae bacterium]|nr:hypothetical protein [Cyclobacteriaceae bacterium]